MHILSLLLLFLTTTAVPVGSRVFTLDYDPAAKGILVNADSIFLVYAFDYWGTTAHQVLRGEAGEIDLFKNVLEPDEGRSHRIAMTRTGKTWKAEIQVSAEARLLSWYFTDGKREDYNDYKTYVSYVCTPEGKPVRGARFANVDFLFMANRRMSEVLEEIRGEIDAYPDNLIAHVVYWRFQYFETISPDTLKLLMAASDKHFAGFRRQLGDTLLNYQIISLNDVDRIIWLSLIERAKDPDVKDLIHSMKSHIIRVAQEILEVKRTDRVKGILAQANDTSATQYDIKAIQAQEQLEIKAMMAEFVGQQAPDFSFRTTTGEKKRLSDLKGRVVLLDFWGSWCGGCVKEIPALRAAEKEFRDRGVVFISVSNDASARKWTEKDLIGFAAKNGMTWMQVLDDPENTITKLYKIRFWPNPFLIGKDGKIFAREKLRGEDLRKTLAGSL